MATIRTHTSVNKWISDTWEVAFDRWCSSRGFDAHKHCRFFSVSTYWRTSGSWGSSGFPSVPKGSSCFSADLCRCLALVRRVVAERTVCAGDVAVRTAPARFSSGAFRDRTETLCCEDGRITSNNNNNGTQPRYSSGVLWIHIFRPLCSAKKTQIICNSSVMYNAYNFTSFQMNSNIEQFNIVVWIF